MRAGDVPWGPETPEAPPLFAIVRAQMAASASPEGRALNVELKLERLANRCPGVIIGLGLWDRSEAPPPPAGDPAVRVDTRLVCFRVSREFEPTLIGMTASGRPASLQLMNGLEYLSADPDQLEGEGASFFVPTSRGGYQVGAFAMAGMLEGTEEPAHRTPIAVIGFTAVWIGTELRTEDFVLSAQSPGRTQFNVGLTVWAGPDGKTPAGTPGAKYQTDVDSASVDELDGATEAEPE